ncbi:MAG: thermonuclease family protein [Nitrospirota bacterium]
MRHLKLFAALVISVLVVFFSVSISGLQKTNSLYVRVLEVNDGDTVTILVDRKKESVRLIGIDAPELGQRPWGKKAKRHLEEILARSGRMVILEFDLEKIDKYDRLLGYLWTTDKRLINLEMLKDGYAMLFTLPPNIKYADLLRQGQRIAREKRLGLWGDEGLKEMPGKYRREHPR